MSARVQTVSYSGLIIGPEQVERLWFFPYGSEYLRYSPHFHMIEASGFRYNVPLMYTFVIVLEGKLSLKNHWGTTMQKLEVRDQVWFERGSQRRVPRIYDMMLPALQQ
jgi:hypothetical protein